MRKPKESDWRVYRDHTQEWRDRYLKRKYAEIAEMLTAGDGTPTERFWGAKEKIEEEAKKLKGCFDPHSRSNMGNNVLSMYSCGVIDDEDLELFSDEFQEWAEGCIEVLC